MTDEYKIDLSSHKATAIRESQIEDMDLILCMTKSHKNSLTSIYPNLADRVFLIKEYIGLSGEVADPYGGTLKIYSECAKELNEYLDLLLIKEGF
jgi:protein-tyrosine-phosphatase